MLDGKNIKTGRRNSEEPEPADARNNQVSGVGTKGEDLYDSFATSMGRQRQTSLPRSGDDEVDPRARVMW